MNDNGVEKRQIKSLGEFKRLLEDGVVNFTNYEFLFPFHADDSGLLLEKLDDIECNFAGSTFFEEVKFCGTRDGNVNLTNIKFQKKVTFYFLKINGYFRAENCIFHDFTLERCNLNNFEFLSSPTNAIVILGNKFSGKFKISQSDTKQIDDRTHREEIAKIKIGELAFITNTIAADELVRFGYLDVGNFHFQDIYNPVGSEINIGECNFNEFALRNLRNSGKFRIYRINTSKKECEKYKKFILTDSSLGDSEFQNVNLACYEESIAENNFLSGLKYTGVQWPNELKTESENFIDRKRDTYRNLKNIALENNDAPQAIEFYAREMQAYKETLSGAKGRWIDKFILWFNRWTNNFGLKSGMDKFILWFNRWRNNFGLNWILPMIWIIVSGVILYTLLLLSCSTSIVCSGNWEKFFIFLNPTHKTEFVCEGHWGVLTYFVDFIFRILEGALIYQTIIAFRKFTRKL